jgi:hypothetical protein
MSSPREELMIVSKLVCVASQYAPNDAKSATKTPSSDRIAATITRVQ